MTDIPPRCPFCASVLKVETSFLSRLGLKASKVSCHTCTRDFDARDAHTMGTQYWNWAELFRKKLTDALEAAPILSEVAALHALGSPYKEDTRLIGSLDELVRNCLRHHRTVLIELARGRESSLDVIHLHNETTAAIEATAIISTSSVESGSHEWEQVIARTGKTGFVLFTYTGKDGAEARVKRALHAGPGRIATSPQAIADLHAAAHGQAPRSMRERLAGFMK